MYVDPIFGDDAQATANNPDDDVTTLRLPPFSQHHDALQFASDVPQGTVRHAPYAFRTLTGASGVAAYLNALDNYLQAESALAVIHCLPGVYGPMFVPGIPSNIDPRSGLPFNGETWPFTLRWYWSLQGTSALDTIFDARETNTAVIIVQADQLSQLSHLESIIDSITVRGARSGSTYTAANAAGAGIYITAQPIQSQLRGTQIGVTISNCFLVDNHVGLAIDNPPVEVLRNFPFIIGNTFARNWIGLWNGSRGPLEPNEGWATPVLLNNIFDSWRPEVLPAGTTPFVGIHPDYITVDGLKIGGSSNYTTLSPVISFCAWEAGRENWPAALPNWPVPGVSGSWTPPYPAPRVDIAPYTGVATGVRGTLFLNDLLRNAGLAGAAEYSAHDYRLAPSVSQNAAPPPTFPAGLNPLVNRGIYIGTYNGHASGIGGIRMAAWTFSPLCVVESAPGPRPEMFAVFHPWDLDGEGFGNPRVVVRSDFPFTGNPNLGDTRIDLGADEMDELILAGFINGTRILSSFVPNAPAVTDHRRLLFVNVADTSRVWDRPWHLTVDGLTYAWWNHVQAAPDGAAGTNYTAGVPNSRRAALRTTFAKPLFMRNLLCDFSPHLLPDPHPLWPLGFQPLGVEVPDIYAANPWWWHDAPDQGPAFRHDNATLYDNWNTALWPVHGTSNIVGASTPFNMPRTAVISGTINPPMTGLFPTVAGLWYLSLPYTVLPLFTPVPPCRGGAGTIYTVDARGLGDSGANCPDLVPVAPGFRGRRFNFQGHSAGLFTNLQTLLSVDGLPPIEEEGAGDGLAPETALRHGRMVQDHLRRRQ